MRKQSKRQLSLALNRAATAAIAGNLASLNYGGQTTPGPRQTAILMQLAASDSATPLADIAEAQSCSRTNTGTALACLRRRGLVRRRGDTFALTVRGADAVSALRGVSLPPGVGLVITNR